MSGSGKGSGDRWLKPEDLLSLHEAAKRTGLSTSHLRFLVNQGDLWGIKVGRNWATTEKAVTQYLARGIKPGPRPRKGTT
jgi:excisionase family DNA binding protein